MYKGNFNQELQARLQAALEECAKLRAENERLRALLGLFSKREHIAEDKVVLLSITEETTHLPPIP